jgi:hypothetical protein
VLLLLLLLPMMMMMMMMMMTISFVWQALEVQYHPGLHVYLVEVMADGCDVYFETRTMACDK